MWKGCVSKACVCPALERPEGCLKAGCVLQHKPHSSAGTAVRRPNDAVFAANLVSVKEHNRIQMKYPWISSDKPMLLLISPKASTS